MTIEECRKKIGRVVTYIRCEGGDKILLETGVITWVNDKNVFVRYGSDINSKATRPEDLTLWVI